MGRGGVGARGNMSSACRVAAFLAGTRNASARSNLNASVWLANGAPNARECAGGRPPANWRQAAPEIGMRRQEEGGKVQPDGRVRAARRQGRTGSTMVIYRTRAPPPTGPGGPFKSQCVCATYAHTFNWCHWGTAQQNVNEIAQPGHEPAHSRDAHLSS